MTLFTPSEIADRLKVKTITVIRPLTLARYQVSCFARARGSELSASGKTRLRNFLLHVNNDQRGWRWGVVIGSDTLSPAHRQMLGKESGISAEVIAARGYRTI